ncbi:hypothetical protein AB3S75_031607 [Citrus x aurantiifolia]
MRNKVKKMGVSRSSLRFRIEPCQLSLLVSIIFFFFSTTSATIAAAASSSSTSTSSGCINNNNNNNNGSMILEQQQGNYCMEENNNYNLELLSIMPVDRSSSRMLGNTADPYSGNTGNRDGPAFNCGRTIPYSDPSCLPRQNSNKHVPEHCGARTYPCG